MTLHHILKAMADHSRDNPTHGYNCSCKGESLRLAKRYFGRHPEQLDEFYYLAQAIRNADFYIRTDKHTTHKLSTGEDSTLAVWLTKCQTIFPPGHPALAHLEAKIAEQGADEEVISDEGQFLYYLAQLGETT